MSEYAISLSEDEKNLLTGSLLNLKADLIEERTDYDDVSDLLDKLRRQRPKKSHPHREVR
jgi:hypothetical protein